MKPETGCTLIGLALIVVSIGLAYVDWEFAGGVVFTLGLAMLALAHFYGAAGDIP